MTEEDKEATPESAAGAAGDADELADFLREFAEYREPEGSADANDFLDTGLPSAAGAARSATEAASQDADESTGSELDEELEIELGATIPLRQLDAMLEGDVVGASLPDEAIEAANEDLFDSLAGTGEAPESAGVDDDSSIDAIEDLEVADVGDETDLTESIFSSAGLPLPVEETAPADSEPGSDVEAGEEPEAELAASMDSDSVEPAALEDEDVSPISAEAVGEASAEISDEADALDAPGDDEVGSVADDTDLTEVSSGDVDESAVDMEGVSAGSSELSQDDIDALLAGPTEEDEPEPVEAVAETEETPGIEAESTDPDGAEAESGDLSQDDIDALFAGATEEDEPEPVEAVAETADTAGLRDESADPDGAEAESGDLSQEEIDALLAGATEVESGEEAGIVEVDAAELSEEDLLAALGAEEIPLEGEGEPFLLDQSEFDSLQPGAVEVETEIGSDALATAFSDASDPEFGSEAAEDEAAAIPVIQAGGGGFLGLPTLAWMGIGAAPVVLILSVVAYAIFGRPSAQAVAEITPEAEVTVLAEQTAAPEPTEAPPSLTPEPTAISAATAVATPAPAPPNLKLPKFLFSDPNEDGINPENGQPRRNVFPEADIVSLEIDTFGPNGRITTGRELTEDGFAGPSSSLEVIVTFRGPLSDVGDADYRLDLYGRFKGAEANDLAPAGIEALAEGSQVAFSISNGDGNWIAEQHIWNRSLNAAVRVGDFTDFAIVQNRLRMSIPSPLLTQLMPTGLEKDDFQFFVRVGYTSDRTTIMDEVGRLDGLVLSGPEVVEIADSVKGGASARKLRNMAGLSELQLRLVSHIEQRARALLSASNPAYLLAQPVAR